MHAGLCLAQPGDNSISFRTYERRAGAAQLGHRPSQSGFIPPDATTPRVKNQRIFAPTRRSDPRCCATASRFASLADAAIVTARQYRLVDRGGPSINSDSSSQSSAESLASSEPNSWVTAPMNADNSRSAMSTSAAQFELQNCSSEFTESTSTFSLQSAAKNPNVDQKLSTSTTALAKASGASCGRLCPTPPVIVR